MSLTWLVTKPSRAMSRCSWAETFGGSGEPSGVCSVARRSAALRSVGLKVRMPSRARVPFIRLTMRVRFSDQALALPIGPLGVLLQHRRDARHAAMAPFPTQPPQETPLQQLGVEPVGLCPSMFARYCD